MVLFIMLSSNCNPSDAIEDRCLSIACNWETCSSKVAIYRLTLPAQIQLSSWLFVFAKLECILWKNKYLTTNMITYKLSCRKRRSSLCFLWTNKQEKHNNQKKRFLLWPFTVTATPKNNQSILISNFYSYLCHTAIYSSHTESV